MSGQIFPPEPGEQTRTEPNGPGLRTDNLVPAVLPGAAVALAPPPSPRRRWRRWLLAFCLVVVAAAGAIAWRLYTAPALPPGIVFSNGRLEADEIDVATKFPGRIAEILVDEGDLVRGGQVLARMDTRDLAAQLAQAEAQTLQAQHTITQSQSQLVQQGSQLKLADQQLQRARALVRENFESREVLDQRQSQFDSATAAYHAIEAQIAAAAAAMQAAIHNADIIRVNIADDTLVAPKDGPIQYRLANVGEVLAAGGKIFTMLDVTYVYMDVFLPTAAAGRVKLGDDARIVLDALPDRPIPAAVSFIASQNQFTPKMVETQSERDKLMFRIRVRIDPALLRAHEAQVRSGLPGLAYIRIDQNTPWPPTLQTRPTK